MAWEDLESMKNLDLILPEEEEFAQYFQDKGNFDSVFNEALATLQDLDVPSGYGQISGPMGMEPSGISDVDMAQKRPSPSHNQGQSPFRHSKKPSGTAIFGFMGHNRDLSFGRSAGYEYLHSMRSAPDSVKSISPSKLAKPQMPLMAISNEQLEYNFNQDLDECKPIQLSEDERQNPPMQKKEHDIIVTNNNPKSYKFPPDAPHIKYDLYMGAGLGKIYHPKQGKEYPEDISGLVDDAKETKGKKYVPIPVQEPEASFKSLLYDSVKRPKSLFKEQLGGADGFSKVDSFAKPSEFPKASEFPKGGEFLLDINNVYLPPPNSDGASHTGSSSPHHLQMYSSPQLQDVAGLGPSPKSELNLSPLRTMNSSNLMSPHISSASPDRFCRGQFFSDDGINEYYSEPIGHLTSSPVQAKTLVPGVGELQSSPLRQPMDTKPTRFEGAADETVTDINETIVQLTPLKQNPMTPSRNKITLEWSPIISPNGKALQVRKAIHDLSLRRLIKTASLLPPGELDRYWEGPDHNKVFTCTYQNCGKKFTRRYNVRSHIQTHLSDRPFTCTYCPKSFVRQHDLNRHVKSHMVLKHAKCRCGKEFTRAEGYKKHLSSGLCFRAADLEGGVSKPGVHRRRLDSMGNILDGVTSNRLNEDLGLG